MVPVTAAPISPSSTAAMVQAPPSGAVIVTVSVERTNITTCPKLYEPQREITYLLSCVTTEDSNQPAHLRSVVNVFVVWMKKLCSLGYPKSDQWNHVWLDCVNAQADLILVWAHVSEGTFCVVAAHPENKHITVNLVLKATRMKQ